MILDCWSPFSLDITTNRYMALVQVTNVVLHTGIFRTVNLLYVIDRAIAVLAPFYYRNVLISP